MQEGEGLKETQLFLLLAVIIGLFSGLSVVLFRVAIDWTKLLAFGSGLTPPWTRVLVVPTIGGLVVAYLVMRFFPRARGSGVNQTKAAVYIFDGYIPFNTVIGKFITCALAIGTGQSLGPEDPSLQMGAGIASALGRRLRLLPRKGAADRAGGRGGGPGGGVQRARFPPSSLSLKKSLGTGPPGCLGAIVLSAVSSVIVSRWFLGDQALFRIPVYHLVHPAELLAYAALGVMGGVSSLAFVKLIAYARPRLKALPRWTQYIQPAVAGLLIGVIGIWFPQVMGAGYGYHRPGHARPIHLADPGAAGRRSKSFPPAFPLSAARRAACSRPRFSSAPCWAAAVGGIEHHFFPWLTGGVGAYALVGMGTLFAGFLRVPLTSVFMVLEVSGNYSIILPVMISNTIAYLISRQYQQTSLFDLLSRQDGMDLPSMEERREEVSVHVEDAMREYRGTVLNMEDPLRWALARAEASSEIFVFVEDDSGKWYGIRKDDLHRQATPIHAGMTLRSLIPPEPLPHVHPDHDLEEALRRLGDLPLLPVVNRANFRKLEGVVGLQEILQAYRHAHQ